MLPWGQPVPPEMTLVILKDGGGVDVVWGRVEATAATVRIGSVNFILDSKSMLIIDRYSML